jgi:hypothetical protein
MKNAIGICGTHGTGKSTVITGLINRGATVSPVQLSREVQSKLGWRTLAGALERLDTMWLLQDTILERMVVRDMTLTVPTFVERTPADVWAYTQVWLERHGVDWQNDSRSLEYLFRLGDHARQHYAMIFILPMRDAIPFVEEPNRADLESRVPVSRNIYHFIDSFKVPRHLIISLSPQERVDEVLQFMTEEDK